MPTYCNLFENVIYVTLNEPTQLLNVTDINDYQVMKYQPFRVIFHQLISF